MKNPPEENKPTEPTCPHCKASGRIVQVRYCKYPDGIMFGMLYCGECSAILGAFQVSVIEKPEGYYVTEIFPPNLRDAKK